MGDPTSKVPFEIGSYHLEVWCDVFTMGICGLKLGSSWQYNQDTCYDGKLNTYIMQLLGCHVRLLLMKNKDPYGYVSMVQRDLEGRDNANKNN